MAGQRVGYIRISTSDQHPDRQLDGQTLDRVFTEHASGKDRNRPQLAALCAFVRTGDTVVVHSMDRLARNLDDLREIVQTLTQRGVAIHFVTKHLTFTGNDSPMATLILSMLGAVAEFERALIREGIAMAKQRGVYKGRKKVLNPATIAQVVDRAAAGESKTALARELGISRETLYQYLRQHATADRTH